MNKNEIQKCVLHPTNSEVQCLSKHIKVEPYIIDKQIKLWLKKSECPFTTSVVILRKSLNKKRFSNHVCKSLAKNLRPYTTEKTSAIKEVKLKIIELFLKFNKRNRKLLVRAFSLNELDMAFVKSTARKLFEKNDFKSFFTYNKLFKIHDARLTNAVLLASISKDNSNILLKYAKSSMHTQIKLLETANNFFSDQYFNLTTVEHYISLKFWVDFKHKLKNRYPIAYSIAKPPKNYIPVRKIQRESVKVRRILTHIDYLMQQWRNKQIAGSSLESLIFRCVGNNCELLEKVACLVEKNLNDKNRADLLRQSLQTGNERTPIWSDGNKIPVKDHELKLAIALKNVNLVDSEKKLKECENYFKRIELSKGNKLPVGFNSEWVTDPVKRGKEDLAIIQLAVKNRVYLVDFVYFQRNNLQSLIEFMQFIFKSRFFIILTFGLSNKKEVLKKYFRKKVLLSWEKNSIDFLKYINAKLYSNICGKFLKFSPQNKNQLTGLSGLCYQVK